MAIQLKPQSVGGLEIAVNGSEAARLAEKSGEFISKEYIVGPYHVIQRPERAKVMKTKGGNVLFYTAPPSPDNHVVQVPEGAKAVQFPDYRAHGERHIEYGAPKFHYHYRK